MQGGDATGPTPPSQMPPGATTVAEATVEPPAVPIVSIEVAAASPTSKDLYFFRPKCKTESEDEPNDVEMNRAIAASMDDQGKSAAASPSSSKDLYFFRPQYKTKSEEASNDDVEMNRAMAASMDTQGKAAAASKQLLFLQPKTKSEAAEDPNNHVEMNRGIAASMDESSSAGATGMSPRKTELHFLRPYHNISGIDPSRSLVESEEAKEELAVDDGTSVWETAEPYMPPGAFSALPGGEMRRNQDLPFALVGSTNASGTNQAPPPPQAAATLSYSAGHPHQLASAASSNNLAVAIPVMEDEALPTAQEHDPTTQRKFFRSRRALGVFVLAMVVFVVGVIALTVVVGLVMSEPEGAPSVASTFLASTDMPTSSPTLSPEEYIKGFLPSYTLDTLERDAAEGNQTSLSPQALALDFLVQDPSLEEYEKWRIQQRFALATFYYATGGDTWFKKTDWLSYSVHECLCYQSDFGGLIDGTNGSEVPNPCEEEEPLSVISHGIFQSLAYTGNRLQGTLPLELHMLSELKILILFSSDLRGTIPTLIGELTSLVFVAIAGTQLSGTLPTEIGLIKHMGGLLIPLNKLTGSLPSELGRLSNLTLMILDSNVSNYSDSMPIVCVFFPSHFSIAFYIQHPHRAWIAHQAVTVATQ